VRQTSVAEVSPRRIAPTISWAVSRAMATRALVVL